MYLTPYGGPGGGGLFLISEVTLYMHYLAPVFRPRGLLARKRPAREPGPKAREAAAHGESTREVLAVYEQSELGVRPTAKRTA